eukprot:Protomagalhaensia_sp_Gyna_25__5619@NODE_780_length_2634_cov_136_451252_g612_i0_p3_GENE_NODE_780_length_2634_cov_136_451252_g612_i0NODE_780_length_2634_cov_136_451252_g612_i0_p3_ORF_typecomplete_len211_score45_71_NODE_780_length_2634_cov_136_451252_g612_i019222554
MRSIVVFSFLAAGTCSDIVKPSTLLEDVLALYTTLQDADRHAGHVVVQVHQTVEQPPAKDLQAMDEEEINDGIAANPIAIESRPIASVLTDAVRNLLTLQNAVFVSVAKHSPFLRKDLPPQQKDHVEPVAVVFLEEKVGQTPLKGQSVMKGQMEEEGVNPFLQLIENAAEVVADSLHTNIKFWTIPWQQLNLLVRDFFGGIAEVIPAPTD